MKTRYQGAKPDSKAQQRKRAERLANPPRRVVCAYCGRDGTVRKLTSGQYVCERCFFSRQAGALR